MFDFTEREDGQKNFEILDPKDFSIFTEQTIANDIEIDTSDNKEDPDFIFELPTEFGGTLDSSQVAKAKESMMTFDIKTGA